MTGTRLRVGMIIPSSNTVVEQELARMGAALPEVSLHYARFRLTAVSVADPAGAYYDSGLIQNAGESLADARCAAIVWNGSAGGVVGFERDRTLCASLEQSTGIRATTSSLAILDVLRQTGAQRFGMVTLNPPEMNATIIGNFRSEGFDCVAQTHRTGLADNFAMAEVAPGELLDMARQCARARPDAIVVYGTNTRGAPLVAALESELGIAVYDSVCAGLWGALRACGADATRLRDLGGFFRVASA